MAARKGKGKLKVVKERVVTVARGAGKRFASGGMEPGTAVAVLAGGVGGAVGSAMLSRKLGPIAAPAAVAVAGAGGAFVMKGKAQAACVGVAVGGVCQGITHALTHDKSKAKSDKAKPDDKPNTDPSQRPGNAVVPPADVQAVFDAARAEMARSRAAHGADDDYPNGYDDAA